MRRFVPGNGTEPSLALLRNPDLIGAWLPVSPQFSISNAKKRYCTYCTRERNWTVTRIAANRILSPACLPVSPPGYINNFKKRPGAANPDLIGACLPVSPPGYVKKNPDKVGIKERKTGLEPATPTLARSCSTKWATSANKSLRTCFPSNVYPVF